VIVNHSGVQSFYICNGEARTGTRAIPETGYLQLTTWRPWVHLWSNHDGEVRIELDQQTMVDYTTYFRRISEGRLALYQFSDFDGKRFKGGFRASNRELTFSFNENFVFVGRCQRET
jgi:hypothetical protein